ncbi:MAG: diaminopimelate decarboxylase [Deltaproteobacteria bacterium]|nr:diaminopimelate decarboxylase [Deltaproteobacteria bacterium]
MKPIYERPSISQHRAGFMNKMSASSAYQPTDSIDGVLVEDLVEAHGSPLFVYSQRTLEDRYQELSGHLARRWPRVQLAWSYKTCYLDAVCKAFHAQGAWAEVVSGMEFQKARRNGIPARNIVFNGPRKTKEELAEAFEGEAIVNIDHFDELALAEKVAGELGIRPKVGIRLNLAAGSSVQRWGRFGFALETGQAWDAVRRMIGGGKLQLAGLHCHIGTFVLDPAGYGVAAGKIAEFANRLRRELGIKLDYLDMGGGFASKARLRSQYLPGEQVSPSFAQYAEAITDGLSALAVPHDETPLLILETGRALVDDAGTLISTVFANKRLPDGRRAMVLDAGVNVLFTSFWYRHDITPCSEPRGVPEPTVVYGPLCMNIDVVCENIMLPPLEVGSRVLIGPVGAYNVTQSMQFIQLRPAVAMISPAGEVAEIRRIETLDDLVMGESVPSWLS